jgi:hypothetical protein
MLLLERQKKEAAHCTPLLPECYTPVEFLFVTIFIMRDSINPWLGLKKKNKTPSDKMPESSPAGPGAVPL